MTTSVILLALASYLAGSIPFGFLIGKAVKGVDLRKLGSGNIGATNAGRVLGKKWGLICLVLDALKGLLPVAFFPQQFFAPNDPGFPHATVLAGVSTIIGHMFPCWLGFRGGKGVATSLGVLAIISPWGLLVAAATFFSSFAIWRYVSLSSMLAAVGFGLFEMFHLKPSPFAESTWSHGVFALMVPALILIQHRSNIFRLLRGEELQFHSKPESLKSGETSAAVRHGFNDPQSIPDQLAESTSFEDQAKASRISLFREFYDFLIDYRVWWLTPLVIVLMLLAGLVFLGGTAAGPLIYPLF